MIAFIGQGIRVGIFDIDWQGVATIQKAPNSQTYQEDD
jgi:hypothetical protein